MIARVRELGRASTFERPIVVTSQCLEFDPCRYNGQRIANDFVRELEPHVDYVHVCPELEIGLGVPREPVRLVRSGSGVRLHQPATGRELTQDMRGFARRFLSELEAVDGFILKSRSPSCGVRGVKVYESTEAATTTARGSGLFAAEVLDAFPGLAIEEEGRLRNARIREHFLTKLFGLARLRAVGRAAEMSGLVAFHTTYKLLLLAHGEVGMRELGKLVANQEALPFTALFARYRDLYARTLTGLPTRAAMVNVFEHVAGRFKRVLAAREKREFRDHLARYRHGRIATAAVAELLVAWARRFGDEYLLSQSFFRPFPEALRGEGD